MRKASVLVLIPFGVLLAVLSGPPGAVPAGVVLAAQARPGTAQASSPASNAQPAAARRAGDHQILAEVSKVLVQSGEAGKTWVDITTNVPTAYHVEHMDHPWRVVVDMRDSRDRTTQHAYSVQSSLLKQVRVGQYRAEPDSHVVRVVAVLVGDTAYDVQQRPGGVRIELDPRPRARDVAPNQANGQPIVQSKVAHESPPAKPAPTAPSKGEKAETSNGGVKAKPPLVAKASTPSRLELRAAGPSPLALKSSAQATELAQPAYHPVPSTLVSTAVQGQQSDTSTAEAKAKPPLVTKASTSLRPESRVANPSTAGPNTTAGAAAASPPAREPIPANSGLIAPPKAAAEGATSLAPAPQVELAQTGGAAPRKSQPPATSGMASTTQGQTFGPEPIAQLAVPPSGMPAREVAAANPGRMAQSDGPVLQRAASATGDTQTQQQPPNPPAGGQTSAPPSGSQPVTLVPEAVVPTAVQPKYTGDLVSMNLKDVDLKDFFRMIHEVSGLNIVVDSGVSGAVTLVLDRVPWDQALDLVLRDNGLGKVLEGNVLRIAKLETLEKQQEDNAKLADAREDAEPLVTVIIPLKYASAVDRTPSQASISGGGAGGGAAGGMGGGGGGGVGSSVVIPGVVSILTGHVSSGGASGGGGGLGQGRSMLSKRGSAIPDTGNNSIILTEVPSRLALIESVIAKVDTPAKQVSIETRIVVASSDFVRSIQSALNFGSTNPSGSTVTGGATGTGASAQGNIPTPTSSGGAAPPRVTVGQTAASGFGAFAISNQSMRYFINAAIAAAETRDQAKVISAPTIVTQNNWPAVVMQGVQIPIQTTINNTISTQFVDAALTLQVTPTVNAGGHLFLQLAVANNSVGAVLTGAAGPSINTQAATTQVMVPDGGTVVFGGVKVTSRTKSITQFPVLGDLPLLGNLFKSSNLEDNDQELLFFVSPKILPD